MKSLEPLLLLCDPDCESLVLAPVVFEELLDEELNIADAPAIVVLTAALEPPVKTFEALYNRVLPPPAWTI